MLRDALDSAESRVDYMKEELAAAEDAVDDTLGNIGREWERK
jgi:phosphate uptake regulator